MNAQTTTINEKAKTKACVAVVVALSCLIGISMPSVAQEGLSAGQAGLLDQSKALSPDRDTLMPPPVVPIDPAASAKHINSTTQELDMEVSKSLNAPNSINAQHMNMHPSTAGVISAQDRRQAAFNSLMQSGNGTKFISQYNSQMFNQGQNYGLAQNSPGPFTQPQLSQPDWLAPQAQRVNSFGSFGQTQTLTASSKHQIVRRDIRRGGIANGIAGALTVGTGLFTGTLNRPNSLAGLGITGLMMTGFGR